jgi:hypothetical protein
MPIIIGQIKHEMNIMKSENREMKKKGVKMGHGGFGRTWLDHQRVQHRGLPTWHHLEQLTEQDKNKEEEENK